MMNALEIFAAISLLVIVVCASILFLCAGLTFAITTIYDVIKDARREKRDKK